MCTCYVRGTLILPAQPPGRRPDQRIDPPGQTEAVYLRPIFTLYLECNREFFLSHCSLRIGLAFTSIMFLLIKTDQ